MQSQPLVGNSSSDARYREWIEEDGLFRRFLSDVSTDAAAWSDTGESLSPADLPPEVREEAHELCVRHRRELRVLKRMGAPAEGRRTAHMALWAAGGRLRGRHDAHLAEGVADLPRLLDVGLGPVIEAWRTFGDYEVGSLVHVRYDQFRTEAACRYHYRRAWLGAFALEGVVIARPEHLRELREGYARRAGGEAGLSRVFTEWLDEERALREKALALAPVPRSAEQTSDTLAHLLLQEVRWRSIERELEKRALWHASQSASGQRVLAALRLGRLDDYDPELAGDDRALRVLSQMGRLTPLSKRNHETLFRSATPLSTGAASA